MTSSLPQSLENPVTCTALSRLSNQLIQLLSIPHPLVTSLGSDSEKDTGHHGLVEHLQHLAADI